MTKVSDLPQTVTREGWKGGPVPFLYCQFCGAESSANRGDYFLCSPDMVLTCCGEPMELVTADRVLKPYDTTNQRS